MKKNLVKVIFILIISFFSFTFTINWLDDINVKIDEDVLDLLIQNSSKVSKENELVNIVVKTVSENKYIDPVSIVLKNYSTSNSKNSGVKEENNDGNKDGNKDGSDSDTDTDKKTPIVYIYNTHQGEKYAYNKTLNMSYSVLDASYYLQKELLKHGINSIVESGSISDILSTNNWNYAQSYRVSRLYLENVIKKEPDLKYFVDLHRDSVSKKISTTTINDKSYARTMFLLGLENKSYEKNKEILERLESWLNQNYQGLSRGIYEKKGKGVNGVYNQDFSKNCILIEVGSEENTYEEVTNTIEVIGQMLYLYEKGEI